MKILITLWLVVFAVALRLWIEDTIYLLRRRRARQPGLNTTADADQFVQQLHAVSATEPGRELTGFEHDATDLRMPIARTTPLVAHLAAETRRLEMTMTRTETVAWDMGTPIYDAVVADFAARRDLAERRRRALEDPTGEFRQIVRHGLYVEAAVLIGRPPRGDRRSDLAGMASGVEDRQPEVSVR